ncbi:VOC family protein [Actinomycetospora straminea]|uniref:VOC family protein n=1 Tax=Actinomycetospora straminea TaxID=663607 RepID=A0ABP9EK81_9PSEU|nr:VOC family protein [Actinomycetospora straminea]MDD7933775.1 VOC family protein [Actinomycetospora straminea]
MSVSTTTHLNFNGEAREALGFYRSVFGGQTMIATYGDLGAPAGSPDAERVVFGQVESDTGFRVMAYDVPTTSPATTLSSGHRASTRRENHTTTLTAEPFFISVRGQSVDEIAAIWDKLAAGATIVADYGPAQWAPAAGMLTDRYGVTWNLDVAAPYAPS